MKRPTKAQIDYAVNVLLRQWREANELRARALKRCATYTQRGIAASHAIADLTGKFPGDIEAALKVGKK